jgi:hypothetical protein
MTGNADIPNLERIAFFHGQRLTARDLTEVQRSHRELRWLHNRSLHAWGIGTGFAVKGERGGSVVDVAPGFGVDCRGREIISTESQDVTVPAVAGDANGGEAIYYLVAVYQDDKDQSIAERRPVVCLPEGTVRLMEEPRIEWRTPEKLTEGMELILAQAWIQHCQLSRPLSFSARRYARPSEQPYIAAGQTVQGNTDWVVWTVGGQTIGVFTEVDTSTARFRTRPHYSAHIVGDRHLLSDSGDILFLVSAITAVVDATQTGFTVQVLVRIEPSSNNNTNLAEVVNKSLKWHVVWMGTEG